MSEYLGHADPATTLRCYTHEALTDSELGAGGVGIPQQGLLAFVLGPPQSTSAPLCPRTVAEIAIDEDLPETSLLGSSVCSL